MPELADLASITRSGAISGNGALHKTGAGGLTVSAPISILGGLTVDAGAMTVSAAISNTSGVTVNAAALTISVAGTYSSGATVNNGGTLTVTTGGGATGLGSGDTFVNAGGTFIGGAGDSFGYTVGTSPNTIHINGGTVTDLGTASYRVTLPNLDFTGGTLTSAAGNAGDVNGNYSLFGKGGAAAWTTNPASTTAVISAATVSLQSPTSFYVAAGSVVGGATPGVDLLVSSNLIPFGANVQPLTKYGAGVMQLSGANTYPGATNVNEGSLVLAATASLASPLITVGAGATFDVSAVAGYGIPSASTINVSDGGLLAAPPISAPVRP